MSDHREDELKKAVEDLKKEVPDWLMEKSVSWKAWMTARLDLLEHQVENLKREQESGIAGFLNALSQRIEILEFEYTNKLIELKERIVKLEKK